MLIYWTNSKTHQMHMDSNRVEIQQLQVQMDLLNKGQSSLATKVAQMSFMS